MVGRAATILRVVRVAPAAHLVDNLRDDGALLVFGRGGGVGGQLREHGAAVGHVAGRLLAGSAAAAPHVVRAGDKLRRQQCRLVVAVAATAITRGRLLLFQRLLECF